MRRSHRFGPCPLCQRTLDLTFHHLIPRKMHRRAHFNKRWTREELQAGIDVCRACHDGIHTLYDEMTLGKRLNTLEALRADEALAKHFSWVSRQRVRGT